MTKAELDIVLNVLNRIKPKEDGTGPYGAVTLAISFVKKDLAVREAQRDNFKDMYDYDEFGGMR